MGHLKRLRLLLRVCRMQRLWLRAQKSQQQQLLRRVHVQKSIREQEHRQQRLLLLLHQQLLPDSWEDLGCSCSKRSIKASSTPAMLTQAPSSPLPSRGFCSFASAAACTLQSTKPKHKQQRQRQKQQNLKSFPKSSVVDSHDATRRAFPASASSAGAAAATAAKGATATAATAGELAASDALPAARPSCASLPSLPRCVLQLSSRQTAAPSAAAAAVTTVRSGAAAQTVRPLACEEQNDEAQMSLYEQQQQQLLLLLQPNLRPNQERSAMSNLLQLNAAQQKQQLPAAFRFPSMPRGLALLLPAIVLRGVLRHAAAAPAACEAPEVKAPGVHTSSCCLTRQRQHVELLRAYALLLPAMIRLFSATGTGSCDTATRSAAAAADAVAEARRHSSFYYMHLLQLHLADAAVAAAVASSCAETTTSSLVAAAEAAAARPAGATHSGLIAAEAAANQHAGSPAHDMHSTWQSVGFQGARAFAAFVGGRACRQLLLELQQLPPFRVAVAALTRAVVVQQHQDARKGSNSSRASGAPEGSGNAPASIESLVLQRGLHAYVFAGVERAAATLLEEIAWDRSSPTETRSPCLRGVLACKLLSSLVRFLQASRELLKQQQQLSPFALKCAKDVLQLARCTSGCNSGTPSAALAVEPSHSDIPIDGAEAVDLPKSRRLLLLLLQWFAVSMRATAGAAVLPHKAAALSWRDVADAAREAARLQAFCAEDAHMQATAPAPAAAASEDRGDGCAVALAVDADRVSNAHLHSGAQEVLLGAAALCTPEVAKIPPADLAAVLWAAVTAASSSPGQQKGQEQQQQLRRQQQQRVQQHFAPLFHAVSATLLLPQQNAQMLLRMREERQEQQQKEQHRLQRQNHHPVPPLQLQSSWQLQQAASLDKSLLTWSLLTWGRSASDSGTAAAACSAAAAAAMSPLGAVEWLVLAASFQKQRQLQQKLLQRSGAMAVHALAVRADELTRPGVVSAATAAGPSSAHVSAVQPNEQHEQTGPCCTRKANEAATIQGAAGRASAAVVALTALPLVRHECSQLLRSMQKAAAVDSLKTVSCSRLLSSLLHSTALLRRIELQTNPCAHENSRSRLPDKAVRREVTTLIVQLLRRLHAVLQQQRLQQQDVRSFCQVVWVMAETGVTHALLLEHLQLQVSNGLHSLSGKQLTSLMCSLFDVGAFQPVALRAAGQQRQQSQQQQQPQQQRQHMHRCLVRSFLHELKLRVLQQQHSRHQHQLTHFHLACCLRAQRVTERLLRMADFLPLLDKEQGQQQQRQQKQEQPQVLHLRQRLLQKTSSNGLSQVYQAALTVVALRSWRPLLKAFISTSGECNDSPAAAATAAAAAAAAAAVAAADDVALPPRVWDAARTAFAKAALSTTESQVQREIAACLQQHGVSFEAEAHTAEGLAVDFRILSLPDQQQVHGSQQQQQQSVQELKGQSQEQREVRLILEVDGPSHFVIDCSDAGDGKLRLLSRGSTLLKEDLLTILGWRVLRLHADAASAAAAKRQLLLLVAQEARAPLLDSSNNGSSSVRSSSSISGSIMGGSDGDLDSGKSARHWQRINRNLNSHACDFS
ncbi:hypothetical protein Esti_006768 [Eimeria stiedai]